MTNRDYDDSCCDRLPARKPRKHPKKAGKAAASGGPKEPRNSISRFLSNMAAVIGSAGGKRPHLAAAELYMRYAQITPEQLESALLYNVDRIVMTRVQRRVAALLPQLAKPKTWNALCTPGEVPATTTAASALKMIADPVTAADTPAALPTPAIAIFPSDALNAAGAASAVRCDSHVANTPTDSTTVAFSSLPRN